MNSSRIRRLVAPAFVVGSLALAGSALAAARPDDRSGLRGVDAINVQPRSPQDVLDAVKRSAPNQVGLAWQYLRDNGQIGESSPQTTLDAVERTSPGQVGLAWQYLRDTGQIATPTTPFRTDPRSTVTVSSQTGFDWSDSGSGAAVAVGLMMLLAGAALTQRRSHRRASTAA